MEVEKTNNETNEHSKQEAAETSIARNSEAELPKGDSPASNEDIRKSGVGEFSVNKSQEGTGSESQRMGIRERLASLQVKNEGADSGNNELKKKDESDSPPASDSPRESNQRDMRAEYAAAARMRRGIER